ncbi:MAG: hypothetical protein J6J86_04795 [Lachnospiraceae bacterium]|nr:hypothetical protein [Lachnospiraceae bacterium]
MAKQLTRKDIDDGRKIKNLFESIDDNKKLLAIGYLSALADSSTNSEENTMKEESNVK